MAYEEETQQLAPKREHAEIEEGCEQTASEPPPAKMQKVTAAPAAIRAHISPKKTASKPARKMRSATSNGTNTKSPTKGDGSQKITAFFKK